MCSVCGCGQSELSLEGHSHDHVHEGLGSHSHYAPASHEHPAGADATRWVRVEQDLLAKNNAYATQNRRHFSERGILALNLVSSPGSGKTALLTRTIAALRAELSIAVIEGDQQTSRDAERIRATGVPALQINTGKGCHLDAHMVGHALEHLPIDDRGVLFIENVGNLVCPAAFDLGEAHKVAILSVTEGDDKPLKYPDMFHAADLVLVNKIDLLPYVDFNLERCTEYARRVHPSVEVLPVSAGTGEGMDAWYRWLELERGCELRTMRGC